MSEFNGFPFTPEGPPIKNKEHETDDEPNLHELGPTPLTDMGVPDPNEVSEEDWLKQQEDQ